MRIGIFDSGVGGEALAASLKMNFPEANIRTVNDRANVPYGSKTKEEITSLTDAAIQPLLRGRCEVIIIACNSATMAAIDTLRQKYPTQNFIGLEPMIKPAAKLTKSGVITVCATPATLASARYRWLLETYAKDIKVLQPDCSDWATMIESGTIQRDKIAPVVDECTGRGADIIVLGCTHYHWIKDMVSQIAGQDILVLEPSDAIARRTESLASAMHHLSVAPDSTDSSKRPVTA